MEKGRGREGKDGKREGGRHKFCRSSNDPSHVLLVLFATPPSHVPGDNGVLVIM